MTQNVTMTKDEFINLIRKSMAQSMPQVNENTPINVRIKTKNKTIDFVGILIDIELEQPK